MSILQHTLWVIVGIIFGWICPDIFALRFLVTLYGITIALYYWGGKTGNFTKE